jgi:hypothetical protein
MVYLCLPMANQGAYIIKKTTRFEVIPAFAGIFLKRNRHPHWTSVVNARSSTGRKTGAAPSVGLVKL